MEKNRPEGLQEEWSELADLYEVEGFIQTDPVQFPHRYRTKQDIEISGFISAWLAYGSRKVFIPVLDKIHRHMDPSPLEFIQNREFTSLCENRTTMYRFCKWHDLYEVCSVLYTIYTTYPSMEEWILASGEEPVHLLQKQFGHIPQIPVFNGASACKKLHMFLRWMVRRDSAVDLGIWKQFDPGELSVPVDTHVLKQAQLWKITSRKQADRETVEEITAFARRIFPDDPARLDFVLYQPPQ
ncbi:MAG: TIGR02757 family protein [Tannerellaceae bacterium]|nr:TIGR02757 family protein [Tannerellaceae bacterium]